MKKNDPDLPAQHKLELMGSNETISYLHQVFIRKFENFQRKSVIPNF